MWYISSTVAVTFTRKGTSTGLVYGAYVCIVGSSGTV